MIRTHDAGALRAEHVGQTVTLAGWVATRRDHGGVAFIDLREASGVVQVVIRDEAVAHQLRAEYCVKVTGEVAATAAKFGKQIRYAERRGIPFVWFPGDPHEVKDIRSGDQVAADPDAWTPPDADLHQTIVDNKEQSP